MPTKINDGSIIRVARTQDPAIASELANQWRELAEAAGLGPLEGPEWTRAMVHCYGHAHHFQLLMAFRGDHLVGVLPMLLGRRTLRGLPIMFLSGAVTEA
ncbi:MAG: hypothetical protein ACRD2D_08610, partial [Terriglobales bacterium]